MNSSRKDALIGELRETFGSLAGQDLSTADAQSSLLDLGFDSLFLTQAAGTLKSRFGVRITFRQMLEELSSIDAIAIHLDQQMPPTSGPAPVVAAPTSTPAVNGVPAPAASSHAPAPQATLRTDLEPQTATGTSPGSVIESVVQEQLRIMELQLALLRGTSGKVPSSVDAAPAPAIANMARSAESPAPRPSAMPAVIEPAAPMAQHGPFRPLDKNLRGGLSEQQRAHLDAFIPRYVARTPKSKDYTQRYRSVLADPRAVAGFKQAWKEMVYPIVTTRSDGARLWDLDGNIWTDVTMGFGVALLGHSPRFITEALKEQLDLGVEIGPQSPIVGEVAELICELTRMDRVTFCNTGSEAVMAALRICRTVTGRTRVALFAGAYHGTFDEVLVKGAWLNGQPKTLAIAPGVAPNLISEVVVLEYGSAKSLEWIRTHADQLACVLVETVQSRHPDLQPREFLQEVRTITRAADTPLIFDEVITGFRSHPGGVQHLFGIEADLATYGKVVGGGMPLGFLAGKSWLMDAFDGGHWQYGDDSFPTVGVTFFAGTFVRHPLAMAAAKAMLLHLKKAGPALQEALTLRTDRMTGELNAYFEKHQIALHLEHFASQWYPHFGESEKYGSLLYYHLREKGLHIWEGRPCFLSTAHSDEDIAFIIDAFKRSVAEMQEGGFLSGTSAPEFATRRERTGNPGGVAAHSDEPVTSTHHGALALTEAQKEIWLASQLGREASCAFNETCSLVFRGRLDEIALRRAISEVIARHDALRCTFSRDGESQHFHPKLEIHVPLVDLSDLKPEARTAQLTQRRNDEGLRAFDLANGPLIALQIIRLADEEHVLVLTVHHIACDGWSYDILLRELSLLYSGITTGTEVRLPAALPFRDFAQWQRSQEESPDGRAAEMFWLQKFESPPDPLELPADRTRPSLRTFGGSRASLELPAELSAALKKSAAKQRSTVFSLLLSAYEVLLFRLSGQADLVVGVPAAGQNLMGCDGLVGHCANLLPLRLTLRPDQSINEVMRDTMTAVLDAYEHQGVTFGALLKKTKITREPNRTPLVSVFFNVDPPLSDIAFNALTHSIELNPRRCYQFDIGFNITEEDGTFTVECDYSTDLFDEVTIERWLRHYRQILTGIAAAPATPVQAISLLTAEERAKLIIGINETSVDYPSDRMVHELISQRADQNPLSIAARFGNASLTYSELDRRAAYLAGRLQKSGVGPDILVAVFLERSLDMLTAILGVLKSGGAYVPLDPDFPPERIALMIEDSAAPVVLTETSLLSSLPGIAAHPICLDREWADIEREAVRPVPVASPENLAYVIYTSGSTGKPKGVEITHRALVNFLSSMQRQPGITERDVVLALTTVSFDIAGLELFLPLVSGASLVILPRRVAIDPHQLIAALAESNATIAQATPATWRMVVEAGWAGNRGLKVLCGGEAITRDLADRLVECCGELWNMYGPTETTIWSTTRRLRAGAPITIGRPIANTQVYVVDSNLQLLPVGVPGELLIGGDGVARGYRNRPDLTAEKFAPDIFRNHSDARIYRTGDQVRLLPNGEIEHLGRLDFQVKIRGFRIELGEIESHLTSHPHVREASVVAHTDQHTNDKRLVAYVVDSRATSGDTGHWGSVWESLFETALHGDKTDGKSLENIDSRIFGWTAEGTDRIEVDRQVSEWIDTTVRRIESLHPHCMLEIGCGTGQLLLRLANQCDEVWGTDITAAAIDALKTRVAQTKGEKGKILLLQQPADRFDGIPVRHFDTVVLNSVTQYFPDTEYLFRVIEGALNAVKEDGRIFVGDIQSATLMECFHTWLELERAAPTTTIGDLRKSVERRARSEDELMIDPGLFEALRIRHPRLKHVEIQLRRGRAANETTLFHYDAVLHVDAVGRRCVEPGWHDGANLSANALEKLLRAFESDVVGIRGISNCRLQRPLAALQLIGTSSAATLVQDIRQQVGNLVAGIELEDLWLIGERFGFNVQVRWNGVGATVDAVFCKPDADGTAPFVVFSKEKPELDFPAYARVPHRPHAGTDLVAELRSYLRTRLPEYMVPTVFVTLDALPRTPNQKIDRRALPDPSASEVDLERHVHIAPRNDTEAKLSEIWKSVLAVQAVSVNDNFFDLGGHSLLAVAAFGKVEESFGIRLPLATLFTAPTIEQLALILDSKSDHKPAWSRLVPIQPNGSRPPCFFIHGAGGNVLLYRGLSRHLGNDIPFYGLQAQGLNGHEPRLTTIEDMAESYLKEIRTLQPHGPYHLGGYCMGGTVAYEIAQRLLGDGEQVGLLALLDTYNFRCAVPVSKATLWRQKVQFHARNLTSLRLRDVTGYIREKARVARDGELVSMFRRSRAPRRPSTDAATDRTGWSMQQTNDEATMAYEPRPFSGKLTVFRARINYDCFPDPQMGWSDLAVGGLEVVELPVNPHAMLVEPFVGSLAAALLARLDATSGTRRDKGQGVETSETSNGSAALASLR